MVKLKGKHLIPLTNFVMAMPLVNWHHGVTIPEYTALTEHIGKLQSKWLTNVSAAMLVTDELVAWANAHPELSALPADADTGQLRDDLQSRLQTAIESLPRSYTFVIALPEFPVVGTFAIPLSKGIRLVARDAVSDPYDHEQLGLAAALRNFGQVSTYLEIEASGYGDESSDSPATGEALSTAKQCAFLLNQYGCCRYSFKIQRSKAFLLEAGKYKVMRVMLPDSIARCFGSLAPNDKNWTAYDEHPNLNALAANRRPAVADHEKIAALQRSLHLVANVLDQRSLSGFEGIATAIEWHQDSRFAENQTMSHLSACIGLEALLGAEEQMDSMSRRLADRYGFMIGKSRKERAQLIEDYLTVLRLRGKLVHGRQARLSAADGHTLRLAQGMLLKVILHELNMLATHDGIFSLFP